MKRTVLQLIFLSLACMVHAQVADMSLCGEWLFLADSANYSNGLPTKAMKVAAALSVARAR